MFSEGFIWGSTPSFFPPPVWKTWEVCLTEPTAGVLKERTEARKEASIPLKCTDNWIPMGCSRRACCDGWVAGALVAVATYPQARGATVLFLQLHSSAKMKVCAIIWLKSKLFQKLYLCRAFERRHDLKSTWFNLSRQRDRWSFARSHTRTWGIYEWGRLRNTSCTKTVQRFIMAACVIYSKS